MEREFDLLQEYLSYWIMHKAPIDLKTQINIWSKHGYIEYGRTVNELPTFEQYKLIKSNGTT